MATLNYVSVCSGIEAATVAWAPLGWNALQGARQLDGGAGRALDR